MTKLEYEKEIKDKEKQLERLLLRVGFMSAPAIQVGIGSIIDEAYQLGMSAGRAEEKKDRLLITGQCDDD
jgi:hypothetical protein